MEPATLLFAEVFGMIAIAAYLTVALVRDRPVSEGPESEHLLEEIPLLNTNVFCPEWRLGAELTIGLDRSGPKARLGVVSCDLTCVGGIAPA